MLAVCRDKGWDRTLLRGVFFNTIGSHHVQGDASSQPDDLQEGAKEDRGEGQGGQGEREGESPLGEIEIIDDIFGQSWYSIEAIIGQLYLREGEGKVHQELVQLPGDASL